MASMNEKDYYAILEVEKDATTDQIRRAFQQKARKLHPDVNKEPDAEERFKEVSEAYAVLSDEEKRRRYDAMRSGNPFGGAAGGYASPAGTAGAGYYGDDPFGGWGFPFGGSYTSRRTMARSRAYNPKQGADIIFEVTLDDEEAAKGVRRGVSYVRYAPCEACQGHGSVAHTHPITCPTCGGTGHISVDLASLFGFGVIEVTCPECEGAGRVVEDPCEQCGGSGRVHTASEVVVDIPKGVHDGSTVRIASMGNAGTNGQSSGDFVCKIALPSERLTSRQAMGFWILGAIVPLLAMLLAFGSIPSILIIGLAVALFMVLRDGVKMSSGWWANAGRSFMGGVQLSIWLVALNLPLLLMGTCSR